MTHSYTKVLDKNEESWAWDVWVCNDCGAHADKSENVRHHPTCTPGESARWQKFYEEAENE
jgi:rubrerythrin